MLQVGDRSLPLDSILRISFATDSPFSDRLCDAGYGSLVEYEEPTTNFFGRNSIKIVSQFVSHSCRVGKVYEQLELIGKQIGFFQIGQDHLVNPRSIQKASQRFSDCGYAIEIEHRISQVGKAVTRRYEMSNCITESESTFRALKNAIAQK